MSLIRSIFVVACLLMACGFAGASLTEGMEIKAEQIDKNEFTNVTTLKKGRIVQADNQLSADEIVLMPQTSSIIASGNCQYQDGKKNIKAPKMVFKIQNGQWIYMKETGKL
ncbi:MAG: hypothetical protein ACAH59_05635 [Pseudobdellovibrionaceae bacterium]